MENLSSTAAPQATESPASPPPLTALPEPKPDVLTQLNEAQREIAALREQLENAHGIERELRTQIEKAEENAFYYALLNLDAGAVLEDAGKKIAELFETVQRLDEKGSFTLKVVAKPFKMACVYDAEIKVSAPKEKGQPAIAYAIDGKLTRHDPRQAEMKFMKGSSRADRSDPADRHAYGKRNEE